MTSRSRTFLQYAPVRALAEAVEETLPPLRTLHRRIYQRHFMQEKEAVRQFAGVFDSYSAALRAIPHRCRIGYDHPEVVDRHLSEAARIWPCDYPVIFWLSRLLTEGTVVFDVGGNIGISYYAFREYLRYPARVTWRVFDVPAIVRRGPELAEARNARGLVFTTDHTQAEASDILLASGSLQFIERSLWDLLARLRDKPPHVLINRTPLCRDGFVTLHNIGPAICPYRIFERGEFRRGMEAIGYTLVDYWKAPEFTCVIPYYPKYMVKAYSGMYLRLKSRSLGSGAERTDSESFRTWWEEEDNSDKAGGC